MNCPTKTSVEKLSRHVRFPFITLFYGNFRILKWRYQYHLPLHRSKLLGLQDGRYLQIQVSERTIDLYPLVLKPGNGKPPLSTGKSMVNRPFSIAMLVIARGYIYIYVYPYVYIYIHMVGTSKYGRYLEILVC